MIEQIKRIDFIRLAIGIVLGAIGGYAYYYFIGCSSGSCPITSSPTTMTAYGVFFGAVLFFKRKKEKQNDEKDSTKDLS